MKNLHVLSLDFALVMFALNQYKKICAKCFKARSYIDDVFPIRSYEWFEMFRLIFDKRAGGGIEDTFHGKLKLFWAQIYWIFESRH